MLIRFFLWLFLFFFCSESVLAQAYGFKIPGGNKVSVDFELQNNLIIIPTIINSSLPLRFILDSGVRSNILTERSISDVMQAHYDRQITFRGIGGKSIVRAWHTNSLSLTIPGVKREGLNSMLVLEEDYLQLQSHLGVEVHGIMGYELFDRFVVKIDYDSERLEFIEPYKFKPKKRYYVFDLMVEDTKPFIYADMVINGGDTVRAKLMIDTGASHATFIEKWQGEKAQAPRKNIATVVGKGLGGVIMGKIARIDYFALNEDIQFTNLLSTFPDNLDYLNKESSVVRNGTIGGEILRRFDVYMDYFHNKLYLKKNGNYRDTFEYNMSGLEIQAEGKELNEFVVMHVEKGSPADSLGIQRGDKILKFNGHFHKSLTLNELNSFFHSKAGRKIRMTLERDGEKFKVKYRLKRMI